MALKKEPKVKIPKGGDATSGKTIFEQQCATCHAMEAVSKPSLIYRVMMPTPPPLLSEELSEDSLERAPRSHIPTPWRRATSSGRQHTFSPMLRPQANTYQEIRWVLQELKRLMSSPTSLPTLNLNHNNPYIWFKHLSKAFHLKQFFFSFGIFGFFCFRNFQKN